MPSESTASMINFDRAGDQGLPRERFHTFCSPTDARDDDWFMRQPRLLVPLASAALWLLLVVAGLAFRELLI